MFDVVAREVEQRHKEFPPQELTNILWALAKSDRRELSQIGQQRHRTRYKAALRLIQQEVVRRADECQVSAGAGPRQRARTTTA